MQYERKNAVRIDKVTFGIHSADPVGVSMDRQPDIEMARLNG